MNARMRRIALFLPNWIGDAVMATPAVRAVRAHFPHARILGVGPGVIHDTLAGAPWFDDRLVLNKKAWRSTLGGLRAFRPDAAVLFPNSLRPALLARLAGCTTVAGFARYFRDSLLSHRLYARRDDRGGFKPVPIVHDYNQIVRRLGVPDPGVRLELFTTPEGEAAADRFWKLVNFSRFPRVVGLNPGGAFGASKHWPTEHFANTARALALQGCGVVVLCGPAEREEAIRIAAAARHPNVVSLTGEPPSVALTKSIVRRLALLITTDSGPRHFAAAFDVPVVTLFGPTHIEWTETYFPKAVHVQERLPCGPCQQRTCPLGHHDCMKKLTPESVLHAARNLLQRHSPEVRHAG